MLHKNDVYTLVPNYIWSPISLVGGISLLNITFCSRTIKNIEKAVNSEPLLLDTKCINKTYTKLNCNISLLKRGCIV